MTPDPVRDAVIDMLADSEAAQREQITVLRDALVNLACYAFWTREAYLQILTRLDTSHRAAIAERDRVADEYERLRDEYRHLREHVMRSAAA
jgi:hypothetical protein